jgi:nucleoside-diphosphate-sugar epimerase
MTRVATIIGGDGFVGRYVVQALLKTGMRVRIASRHTKHGWFMKAQANHAPRNATRSP